MTQLLVYFAGHGVNLQRQEYWLLTDAPDDTQAAVNAATSVALAATCGIPHIVMVSDACRTAPDDDFRLRVFDVRLPATPAVLEKARLPSLWTMFDAKGVDLIRKAFAQGQLR